MAWTPETQSAAIEGGAGLIGMGLDLATTNWRYKKQYEQSKKLQNLQIKGQKEMGLYNQKLALDTWDKTGAAAQRRQLEKAGLNVGLMYEGGGAGGTTSGGANGNVSGQSAGMPDSPTGAAGMGMQIGMQMQLLKAQKENIEADTKLKETEANKKGGVDTENVQANTAKLIQDTNNAKLQGTFQEIQNNIARVQENIANETEESIIQTIKTSADKLKSEADIQRNQKQISDNTYNEIIKQTRQSTIEQSLRMNQLKAQTEATKAGTKATEKGIELTDQQINKIASEITRWENQTNREWQELSIKEQQLELEKAGVDFATGTGAKTERVFRIINQTLGAVGGLLK